MGSQFCDEDAKKTCMGKTQKQGDLKTYSGFITRLLRILNPIA